MHHRNGPGILEKNWLAPKPQSRHVNGNCFTADAREKRGWVIVLHERLTNEIIRAFYYVYNRLGYGFVESVYSRALAHVLRKRGFFVECEAAIEVWFEGIRVGVFKADMIVERAVVLENKASRSITDADWKQLLNQLNATDFEVGLLLHFGPSAAFKRLVYSNKFKRYRKLLSTKL
jgi:GxxExxY protein